MSARNFPLLVLLLFGAEILFAQDVNPRYNFRHLNVQNGLAQNIVYHFLQDSRGYIWLGTRNGLTLFDGSHTTNFTYDNSEPHSLGNNFITGIYEDSMHQVWVGNGSGLDLYNKAENNFIHFGILVSDSTLQNVFCVPLGISNGNDLWYLETKTKTIGVFNTITRKQKTMAGTDAVDGKLWVNPADRSIHIWTYLSLGTWHYVFQNGELYKKEKFFGREAGIATPDPLEIFHVLPQKDSLVWISCTKGLIRLNPLSGGYRLFNRFNKIPVAETRFSAIAPNNLLWVATGGQGIFTFDPKSGEFRENFRNTELDPMSICSNNIVSLYFDFMGNIWCGSYGNGVSYTSVQSNFFSKYLSKTETRGWNQSNTVQWLGIDSNQNTWCILDNSADFWLLDSGLHLRQRIVPRFEDGKPFSFPVYQIFFEKNKPAWCLSSQGLFRYNIGRNTMQQVYYSKLSDQLFGSYWLNHMIRLHDGSLLFSTFGGLYRIPAPDSGKYIAPFSSLNDSAFNSFGLLFEDRNKNILVKDAGNNLYILSSRKGMDSYQPVKQVRITGDLLQYQEDPSNQVIYLATDNGLFVLHQDTWQLEKIIPDRVPPVSNINSLLLRKDKLWIFTENGLYAIEKTGRRGRRYTIEDGLPSNEFVPAANFLLRDGKCIAGTTNGLVAFYPDQLHDTLYPPKIQLLNLYLNDTLVRSLSSLQELSKIILKHTQTTFAFDYSPIAFQHAGQCSFLYKLEKYDEDWISTTHTNTRYSRIPPGKYTFRLRVVDAGGRISPDEKVLEIEISKAWWQTAYARIAFILAVAGIGWLLLKWYLSARIRQQRGEFEKQQAIEKERTRIATDMHDDLGAGLSRIKFLSETIGLKKQMQQPYEEEIGSIGSYAGEMIGKMGEIVWALNEKNDSLSDLLSYTRAYASSYLEENGIRCNITAPEHLPAGFVSGEFRRNIFLTVKEALHNVVKHSGSGKVDFEMDTGQKLILTIRDYGTGFDPGRVRSFSNGLTSMQKRIESIGGKLLIQNREGTRIRIEVPLPI